MEKRGLELEKVGMKKQRKVQIVRDEGRKGKHKSRERGRERYIYTQFIVVITVAISNGTGKALFSFRFYLICFWVMICF